MTVRETLLTTTERQDGDCVQLSVKDSGIGSDPEAMAKLFEAFYSTKTFL
jgi:signal transduction histidine kinase